VLGVVRFATNIKYLYEEGGLVGTDEGKYALEVNKTG